MTRRDVRWGATGRTVRRGLAGLLSVLAAPLVAYEMNTWVSTTADTTPATALDWTADANWSLGHAPAVGDDVKFAANLGTQFIRLSDAVTVGDLRLADNTFLLGEQLAITSTGNGRTPRVYKGWLFADLTLQAAAGSLSPWLGENQMVCGRLLSPHGFVIPASNTLNLRLDRYATSPDPLRTDDLQVGAAYGFHPGNASFAAYVEGAEASSSAWAQASGSPYLALADATAATVAVGAAVTGAGIPEGTWVRRRFTEKWIELSQPATETQSSNVLAFAAFHPDARLHVPLYKRQGDSGSMLRLHKRQAADGLSLEIDTFNNASGGQYWLLGISEGDAAGWLPGTLVLHAVTGGHRKGPSDVLRNCHLLFAGTTAGDGTVFDENRIMSFEKAAYTARLTVTNGVGAVANFTNFVGTLVKDGAGTLRIGLADAANAGSIVLEGGTLALTARDTAGTDGVSFAALTMAAGTTLQVPEAGLRVATATFGDGVTVCGPGTLRVRSVPAGGRVTCRDGARIVYELGAADAYVHDAEAQVAGHPAFWVDASRADSLVCEEVDGVKYVTRWNDCRAGEPMFCTNVVRRPRLAVDEATGAAKYVKISYVNTHWYTNTEGLVWSQPIDGIRAVFLVQDPTDGGGEILGRTSRLGDNRYGTQGGPYYRSGTANCQDCFISPNFATPCVKFGRFFRNGEEVRGYEKGYLGNFLQLVEHHVNTNETASWAYRELACDAFGTGGYRDGHEFNNANGRQRIAECLVYTNSLTHAERVRTALYLSRKWLGKDIVYSDVDTEAFADELPRAETGETVDVAAERTFGVRRVENGEAVEKTGAGRLVVESLAAGAVTVWDGELCVKSLSLANTSVPPDAWVHVDAADAATLDLAADGTTVAQWRNLTGDGQTYRPLVGGPTRVANALNGLPVVDCGTLNGADKAAFQLYTAAGAPVEHNNDGTQGFITGIPAYKSVFIVYGSQGGGNSLLGCYGNGFPYQGLAHCPSEPGLPLFTATTSQGHVAWHSDVAKAFSNGTHVARLNGVPFDPFTTPFSGGYDQITVSGNFSRKSDTLATYGQLTQYVGGLSYGEVLVYSNQLDAATLPKVEAYLRKKWFDVDTAGFRRATCAALHVEAGARVTVGDWAVARGGTAYTAGAGTLTASGLGGGGTVCGTLELAEEGVFMAAIEADALPTLTVEGTLTLPRAATLHVTGDVARLPLGRHVLAACGTLVGDAAGWTVQAPKTPHRSYVLRCEAGELALVVSNAGSVLIFR